MTVDPGVAALALNWTESDKADHYEIWFKKTNSLLEGYRLHGCYTGSSARITDLSSGFSYSFRMRSVNSDSKSDYIDFPPAIPDFGIIYRYAESGTQLTYRETAGAYNESVLVEAAPDNLYYPLIRDGITQIFLGWNTQPDGSGKDYAPNDPLVLSYPVILYAQLTTDDSVCGKEGPAGGIICYDAGSEQSWGRYIEAAPFSETYFGIWGDKDWVLLGTETAIGSGKENTSLIANKAVDLGITTVTTYMPDGITRFGTSPIGALVCNDLVINNYNDWFLPSEKEAIEIFDYLPAKGLTMYYGTSSEFNSEESYYCEVLNDISTSIKKYKDARIDIGLAGMYAVPRLLPVRYF